MTTIHGHKKKRSTFTRHGGSPSFVSNQTRKNNQASNRFIKAFTRSLAMLKLGKR